MKQLAFLVGSFMALLATAQSPYRPFPGPGAGWSVASNGLHFGCNPVEVFETTNTYLMGDTVYVGGQPYVELIRSEVGSWMNPGPPGVGCPQQSGTIDIPGYSYAIIRQDIATRQVFAGPNASDLLYDFSIGLGTYPQTVENFLYPNLKVVALDSVLLNDGFHRSWILGVEDLGTIQDSAFCSVIEGIGSTFGPLPFAGLTLPFEFSDTLTCFSDGTNVIHPLGATSCDIATGTGDRFQLLPGPLTAFPCPAEREIQLTGPFGCGSSYVISDLTGKTVQCGMLAGSMINIRALPSAVYVIHVIDRMGVPVAQTRLVKE